MSSEMHPGRSEEIAMPPAAEPERPQSESSGIIAMAKSDIRAIYKYIREVHWKVILKQSTRRRFWKWYLLLAVAITLTALVSSYHHDIVTFCRPITATIRSFPAGWLIPIALLVVLSFPPLVGHEIVGILLGLVYGLWAGFGILAAGTFFGEIGTWIAFKSCCSARAAKFEKQNKLYASLTQLIREKSFMFVLLLRFSALPGHITTAVSASAGANFWSYLAAAFLTLPKQLSTVYLGQAFDSKNKTTHMVSILVMALTILGTAVAAVYIYYQMRLLIIRNNALQLPTSTSDPSLPAWEDVQRSDGGTAMTEVAGGAHARRPWLYSNGSYSNTPGTWTPTRSKSLPGPLADEDTLQWVEEMRYNDTTPGIAVHDAEDDKESTFTPFFSIDRLSAETPVPTRPTPTRTNSRAALLPSSSVTAPASASAHRDTVSLDLVRDPVPELRGGREIAADADAYAVARGAKRPGYGRSRGDSGAALLGRGDWDQS